MIILREKSYGKSFCSIEPATAMLIGGGISAGGSILSGLFGSSGSKAQAKAIIEAANIQRQTALELDAKQRADLQPFMGFGTKAGDTLLNMLSGTQSVGDVISASPGFQWAEQEGMRMLNRQLTARGQWNSGAGLETLARFSGQLTSDFESKYYDRLYNLTTLGANAAARASTNTVGIGATALNNQTQLGLAGAQAIGNQYGAWAGTASQLGSLGQTFAQYPMYAASIGALNRMGTGAPLNLPAVPTLAEGFGTGGSMQATRLGLTGV